MAGLQEFKCPCCGGAIAFDSKIQKMKCPYCDTEFEMDALKGYDAELQNEQTDDMEWDTSAGSEWQEGETDGLRTYVCKSCGGEIVGDDNMAATSCPFCDNPIIMMGQFAGALKPDLVIPFKLDKKAAKEGQKKHLTGKRLLPKIFKDQNHIDEIKGIYVPFWLFDTNVDATVSYRATKVRMWSDSDYDYTETSHFMVHRGGNIGFENVPVDGSTKMADDLMESIEPFNISGAVDFQTAYLAGYLADKYDVTAEQSIERANKRVKHSTEEAFAETVKGYATVTTDNSSVQFHGGKAKYALYPVWLLNTTWNGNKYTFAMNGQTGKFVGDLPVDKGAAARWTVMLAAVFSVVTYGAAWLLHLIGLFQGGGEMKKRILSFMTILILCLGLAVPAFADETEGFANEYPRVIDNAELLSTDERELLTSKLDEISTRQKVDVTVATTDTLDGLTVSDYAERFYESHNYGYGPDKDGTILLISMEDHDWYMATYGYAITAFTDAGIQYIGEEMTGDLSDGDFAAAFDTFADECDDFITQAKTGEPYDIDNEPQKPMSWFWIPISLVAGIVLSLIVVGTMKSKLKTVRFQAAANNYVKAGSMNLTESRDIFLYNTMTKTKKEKNDSSSGGGGSSTHTTSSGSTAGGGGGKFQERCPDTEYRGNFNSEKREAISQMIGNWLLFLNSVIICPHPQNVS